MTAFLLPVSFVPPTVGTAAATGATNAAVSLLQPLGPLTSTGAALSTLTSSTSSAAAVALSTAAVARGLTSSSSSSTTALQMGAPHHMVLHDCTSGALAFFNGIRVTSALIAGSALAALFALVKRYQQEDKNKTDRILLRIFHACALFAYLLSVTAVISSTTANTTLLMGKFDPMATSVYYFLKREMEFEFVLTRWCFLSSVLNFLTAIGSRVMLEFDLMTAERRLERGILITSFTAMIAHLLSVINRSLNCWPNLMAMTIDLLRMSISRALNGNTMACIGITSAASAVFMVMYSLYREFRDDEYNARLRATQRANGWDKKEA